MLVILTGSLEEADTEEEAQKFQEVSSLGSIVYIVCVFRSVESGRMEEKRFQRRGQEER